MLITPGPAGEAEQRYHRALAAAGALSASAGPQHAQQALETLATILQVGHTVQHLMCCSSRPIISMLDTT